MGFLEVVQCNFLDGRGLKCINMAMESQNSLSFTLRVSDATAFQDHLIREQSGVYTERGFPLPADDMLCFIRNCVLRRLESLLNGTSGGVSGDTIFVRFSNDVAAEDVDGARKAALKFNLPGLELKAVA